MNRLSHLLALTVAAGLLEAAPSAQPPAAVPPAAATRPSATDPWPDTLTLTNGTVVRCRIRHASPTTLAIEYPRRGSSDPSPLTREVPWSGVRSAEFSMDEAFHRLLAATDPRQDLARLATRWSTLTPMLDRPHHPAGDLGLALARLSLTHPDTAPRQRALNVCREIAARDWQTARRHQARLLLAQLLTTLGRSDEAATEARQLARDSTAPPDTRMPAWVMVARIDFAALQKLEEQNPKWEEDDTVRPQRETLFHQALDAALKPSLFHGSLETPASEGLWIAVEGLAHADQLPAAADTARDLIRLHPATPRAADAHAFLQRHQRPLDPDAPPDPPPTPTTTTAAPTTTTPPSPATTHTVHRRPRYSPSPSPSSARPSSPSSS